MGAELVLIAASMLGANDVTLVQFSAEWCEHCQGMRSTVARLESSGYPVQNVDVDREKEAIRRHRVRALPTFVLMKQGKEIKRLEGEVSYSQLAQLFDDAGFRPTSTKPSESSGLLSGALKQIKQAAAQVASTGQIQSASQLEQGGNTSVSLPTQAPIQAPIQAPTQAPIKLTKAQAQAKALQASVRLRIEDETGYSFGTGTIVDTHGDDALVLTCGHIFRDSKGKGQILVQIYSPTGVKTVEGKLLAFEPDYRDIGLVAIRPGVPVEAARVSAKPAFRPSDFVFTVGCDRGADPSVKEGRIISLNRFVGSPNIQVTGRPIVGRSGGGLFNADGELIGVCKLANASEDEGIYAALPSVHFHLDQVGLTQVYKRNDSRQLAAASTPKGGPRLSATPAIAKQIPPITQASLTQLGNTRGDLIRGAQSVLGQVGPDSEVIIIVRPKNNPNAPSQIVRMSDVSDELMDVLRRSLDAKPAGGPSVPAQATMPGPGEGRLIRAQSEQ